MNFQSLPTAQTPKQMSFLRNHSYLARKPNVPLPGLQLQNLGEATFENSAENGPYVDHIVTLMTPLFSESTSPNEQPTPLAPPEYAFVAGQRSHLFWNPSTVTCGIVTCGGLCPGLNNVIRGIVYALHYGYKVPKVYGFKFGFEGLMAPNEPILLTDELVKDIHLTGGSILGSSRGAQPAIQCVETLLKYKIDILFTIGGDGTLAGAQSIVQEIQRRDLKIGVVGIPKTIDNDITYVDATFGFQTAVAKSMDAIYAVHSEARSAKGGVGVVKLMGRDAGFIALHATLSNGDVNMVLIPEVKFDLAIVLAHVEKRVRNRGHIVVLVAEGAGQHLFEGMPDEYDRSGNRLQHDIGRFLSKKIDEYLSSKKIEHTVKYVDPSYTIRSAVATPADALLCVQMANNAVHAALAGLTNIVIAHHHNTFTLIPIDRSIYFIKRVNPDGPLYRTMLDQTGMPINLKTEVDPTSNVVQTPIGLSAPSQK